MELFPEIGLEEKKFDGIIDNKRKRKRKRTRTRKRKRKEKPSVFPFVCSYTLISFLQHLQNGKAWKIKEDTWRALQKDLNSIFWVSLIGLHFWVLRSLMCYIRYPLFLLLTFSLFHFSLFLFSLFLFPFFPPSFFFLPSFP